MRKRASAPFNRVADRYDETRGGDARGAHLAAEVAQWLTAGLVLEVGVGTGVVAAALRDLGYEVIGVDLSPAMLAHARTRLGPRIAVGDALALPVASSAVENVLFVAALHVIGDVPGAVDEAARVLRPGGRLVVIHDRPIRDVDHIEEAIEPLAALRQIRPDSTEAVTAAARAARLRPVAETTTGPDRWAESPDHVADLVEARVWQPLWDVDDTTWATTVGPVVARLRALPDPDRPRHRVERHRLAVFTR